MYSFTIPEIVDFLKTVQAAPKHFINYKDMPGHLDPDAFDTLSRICHRRGYIIRHPGVLGSQNINAEITCEGKRFISNNTP